MTARFEIDKLPGTDTLRALILMDLEGKAAGIHGVEHTERPFGESQPACARGGLIKANPAKTRQIKVLNWLVSGSKTRFSKQTNGLIRDVPQPFGKVTADKLSRTINARLRFGVRQSSGAFRLSAAYSIAGSVFDSRVPKRQRTGALQNASDAVPFGVHRSPKNSVGEELNLWERHPVPVARHA